MAATGVITLGNFSSKVFRNKIAPSTVVTKKHHGKAIMFHSINGEKFHERYYSCLTTTK